MFNGQTLSKIIKKSGLLSEPEAKDLIRAIALTLRYCHEIGVAHRDIKPENVMVGPVADLAIQPPGGKGMTTEPASDFLKGKQIMLIDFAFAASCSGPKKIDATSGTP